MSQLADLSRHWFLGAICHGSCRQSDEIARSEYRVKVPALLAGPAPRSGSPAGGYVRRALRIRGARCQCQSAPPRQRSPRGPPPASARPRETSRRRTRPRAKCGSASKRPPGTPGPQGPRPWLRAAARPNRQSRLPPPGEHRRSMNLCRKHARSTGSCRFRCARAWKPAGSNVRGARERRSPRADSVALGSPDFPRA